MTHEQALRKLKDRIKSDVADLEREILRLNGKHEAYARTLELIDSLLYEIEKSGKEDK